VSPPSKLELKEFPISTQNYILMMKMYLLVLILTVVTAFGSSKVADRWKAHHVIHEKEGTSRSDAEILEFLRSTLPMALEHTGDTSFDQHLSGVQAILRKWGAAEHVCSAGLLHSIYGTEGFQGFKLPLDKRPVIRQLLGEKSERLVWIFCMVDRNSVDETVRDAANQDQVKGFVFKSRVELGSFDIPVSDVEWLDFIELVLADWLEQVEGASEKENKAFGWSVGEAWSYRREAYSNMAKLLSQHVPRLRGVADAMHREVYAVESETTKRLHMPITPPMSSAAREAREALASRFL